MKAQVIYDLAHQTAWISGDEMHDYLEFLTGEPSPSGRVEVDSAKLKELVNNDKELAGLLMGLATFGGNQDVKNFLESKSGMSWSLGY